VRAFEIGAARAEPWADPQTRVWGLRVPQAIGDFLILEALRQTEGCALAVNEAEIEAMTARVARLEGRRVGPEGAACLLAVDHLLDSGAVEPGARVVVFQTGHPDNY
jgi:threonine synthase